jgi:hypothetical protein
MTSSLALSLIVKIITMKTISKTTKLNLQKFQIAKLNNLTTITGGANANNLKEDQEEDFPTTTDTWTTLGG